MTNGNYTIELTGINNTIIKNTLIADILVGNECVKADNTTNTINNNKPTYKNIILTDDNYKQYFNENSTFVAPENMTDIHLLLKGNFYNKDFIFNTTLNIAIEVSPCALSLASLIVSFIIDTIPTGPDRF